MSAETAGAKIPRREIFRKYKECIEKDFGMITAVFEGIISAMIIAGIDEAGYGPLLGPLVVSATAFELDGVALEVDSGEALPPVCMWRALRSVVAKKGPAKQGRVLVADSKVVHNLAEGNKLLERGVLAFFR